MSIGNANIHQQGEIPEIIKLPNDRIRVIRRFQKFTREDVDNANLGSLMGDFGDLDTSNEQIPNQGYSDCRLISVEVDTRFNQQANADNAVLVKTYETLTNEFVEISSDTKEIGESNLKKITKVYRAISGTTSSNTVGTTPLNPIDPADTEAVSDGIILASSKIEDNTGIAELTEEYIESGVLSVSQSHRYGDTVEVYSVEGINITENEAKAAVTGLPTSAKFYGKKTSNLLGLETNTFEFFTGSGVISNLETKSHNNKLTKTTIVSIDVKPSAPSDSVLIESKSETRDEFVLYTYTFVSGTGVISTETSNKYGTLLDVVTVTTINAEATVPAGAFVKESTVREEDGYVLRSTTYVSGEGLVSETGSTKYQGKLEIESQVWLNTADPTVPAGYTLIGTDTKEGEYGFLTTITYAKGEGEISTNTDNRSDGSIVKTFVILGDEKPTVESGYYLLEESYQAQDGYDIYTYYYYKKPQDYSISVSTTWNNPARLGWNREEGFHIDVVGTVDPISGTASVTFSSTKPSGVALSDLSVGTVARESVKYEDGTRLVRSTAFTNTYYGGLGGIGGPITGGDYLGEPATVGVVSTSGQELPYGTVTLGWESVPYFYAGGTTIWKTTHTTGTI